MKTSISLNPQPQLVSRTLRPPAESGEVPGSPRSPRGGEICPQSQEAAGRISLGFSIYIRQPPLWPAGGHPQRGVQPPSLWARSRAAASPAPASAEPALLLWGEAAMHGGEASGP